MTETRHRPDDELTGDQDAQPPGAAPPDHAAAEEREVIGSDSPVPDAPGAGTDDRYEAV